MQQDPVDARAGSALACHSSATAATAEASDQHRRASIKFLDLGIAGTGPRGAMLATISFVTLALADLLAGTGILRPITSVALVGYGAA
jgi:hypothetical protein